MCDPVLPIQSRYVPINYHLTLILPAATNLSATKVAFRFYFCAHTYVHISITLPLAVHAREYSAPNRYSVISLTGHSAACTDDCQVMSECVMHH